MIKADALTKRYGGLTAIRGVSFEIAKSEVVGFLGPNGAGKTTTMRILTGYLPWYYGCLPSPNQANSYQPEPVPSPTPTPQVGPVEGYFSACPLTNVNETIELAECILPGLDIWNPVYWDAPDFNTLPLYLENENYPLVLLE